MSAAEISSFPCCLSWLRYFFFFFLEQKYSIFPPSTTPSFPLCFLKIFYKIEIIPALFLFIMSFNLKMPILLLGEGDIFFENILIF